MQGCRQLSTLSLIAGFASGPGCLTGAIARFGPNTSSGASTGTTGTAPGGSSSGTSGGTGGCLLPHLVTADLELTTTCDPWTIGAAGTDVEGDGGPHLTIDPGVTVSVAPNGSLLVGLYSPGQLQVRGTAADPVIFTSSLSKPGSWVGIFLGGYSNGSALTATSISYAGVPNPVLGIQNPGALMVLQTSSPVEVLLEDVALTNSGAGGFVFAGPEAGLAAGSSNLTVSGWASGSYPFQVDANQAGSLPANLGVGAGSGPAMVAVSCQGPQDCDGGMSVDHTETWPAIPIPYAILSAAGVNVDGRDGGVATLTIAAPNTLEFVDQSALQVDGLATGQGELVAIGTQAQPIVFESIDQLPAYDAWRGIQLVADNFGALLPSSLAYCQIADATGFSVAQEGLVFAGALTVNGITAENATGPTITDCTFANYGGCGIFTRGIRNAAVYGSSGSGNAFSASPDAPGGTTLSRDVCSLAGPVVGPDCRLPTLIWESRELTTDCDPWYITSYGTMVASPANNPVLTIDPGVTVAADTGGYLIIDSPGGLQVNGTSSSPVTFTSWASQVPGSWVGIVLTSVAAGSALSWTTVSYAGQSGDEIFPPLPSSSNPGAIVVQGDVDPGLVSFAHVTVQNTGASAFAFVGHWAGLAAGSGSLVADDWASGYYPFVIDANQAGSLPTSLVIGAESGPAAVALGCQGEQDCSSPMNVDHSQTWPAIPVPYAILSAAGVNVDGDGGGATLTIAAPNTLQFADQSALWVDSFATGQGELVAVGAPGNRIAFVGANPDGGASWQGIRLSYPAANGNPYAGTELEYCEVNNAGLGSGATSTTGEITLDATAYNLSSGDLAVGPSITNCQFSTYDGCGILAEYVSNASTYGTLGSGTAGNTFEGGSYDVCTSNN